MSFERLAGPWVLGVAVTAAAGLAHAGGPAYAHEVIQYAPTFGSQRAPSRHHSRPLQAVGAPKRAKDVSLGHGGLLELGFGPAVLTNSGDARPDLRVVEVGPDVESTFVAVMPADEATAKAVAPFCQDLRAPFDDGFCEVGGISGGTVRLDLDAFFPGQRAGALRFSAVQLVDDPEQGRDHGRSVGADIAGVLAFFHQPARAAEQNFFDGPAKDIGPQQGVGAPSAAVVPPSLPAVPAPPAVPTFVKR